MRPIQRTMPVVFAMENYRHYWGRTSKYII